MSKFEVRKMHKLSDQIEQLAYDWAWEDVTEHFGIEEVEDLTAEQVDEIYSYSESEECYEGYVGTVLRTICNQWEDSRYGE